MENQIQNTDYKCTQCHYPLVSKLVQAYSKRWFGRVLCRTCQNIAKGEKIIKDHTGHETITTEHGEACITCQIKSEVNE